MHLLSTLKFVFLSCLIILLTAQRPDSKDDNVQQQVQSKLEALSIDDQLSYLQKLAEEQEKSENVQKNSQRVQRDDLTGDEEEEESLRIVQDPKTETDEKTKEDSKIVYTNEDVNTVRNEPSITNPNRPYSLPRLAFITAISVLAVAFFLSFLMAIIPTLRTMIAIPFRDKTSHKKRSV
eukprot:TRINITY_DN2159_c0_g1_i1.p1 TRINITY_DN2159_c0_g1~~TRINITY_DN2159_c0_g1_i1.p1  ORF type:complete len:179 (-),score=43.07 TRINITY_DN2159_c0_g1_i1:51-587(-)